MRRDEKRRDGMGYPTMILQREEKRREEMGYPTMILQREKKRREGVPPDTPERGEEAG